MAQTLVEVKRLNMHRSGVMHLVNRTGKAPESGTVVIQLDVLAIILIIKFIMHMEVKENAMQR